MNQIEAEIKLTVKEFVAAGYCRISNKFGLLARLDRADWLEHMAAKMYPFHPDTQRHYVQEKRANKHMLMRAADFYRRVYSKDQITLDHYIARKHFPNSLDGPTEFKAKQ